MRWSSLRLRLVAAGTVAILLALGIAGAALVLLFQRHVSRNLTSDLDVHLTQLLAGIDIRPDGQLVIARDPADPRFHEPLSGLYWQVSDDRGQMLRSRSLWDMALPLPVDEPGPREVHQHEMAGPGGARLLVAERRVTMTAATERVQVRAAVASDLSRTAVATRAFARDLSLALGLLALVLAAATSVQVSLGLRPLAVLRRGVAEIRTGHGTRLPVAVPSEVEPLVTEFNALLAAQEREIVRSRSRAADLAHGFKTPLAALVADAGRLRRRGEIKLAHDIEAVVDTMSRHVDRELALARLRGGARAAAVSTELAPLVASLVSTLSRTPSGEHLQFECAVAAGARLPFDRTDLAEVLGNILENAAHHARSKVQVTATLAPLGIAIDDDGDGIPEDQVARVLERGGRLDQRGAGAGLGLSIVRQVLDAYGWHLQIGRSELGGVRAKIAPNPAAASRVMHAETVSS